ncbi:LysR family transcriptional regulator [Aneurinibacillus tyrosinisolvens]|uniref:LysR family transcriptional regulator n=1 Tax=Aneurinibacillus tyrosinisolvens TaxID=1443435 RepID=UPI00063F0056|nr:LysR family transcriptional regulator [Aneurinibacillus tyrosinisolvens]
MEWHQLEYFRKLTKVQNFTKAADELALTQSALSRSIARLEEELGVPLFERKIRGVILNRYGEAFLKHVNRAMMEMTLAKQELQDMVDPFRGTISLAFIYTLGKSFVPDLISAFREQYPGIQFQLTQDATRKIVNQLESGEIDLGFCSPNEEMENISTVPVINEELFLIVPKDHHLADKKEVDLSEVAHEPFVHYKHETGLREVIDKLCRRAGFQPEVYFEGSEDTMIAGLVAANFGVALIPFLPGLDMTKISLLHIREPQCRRVIQMAWRSNGYMSPAFVRFKNFVKETRVQFT